MKCSLYAYFEFQINLVWEWQRICRTDGILKLWLAPLNAATATPWCLNQFFRSTICELSMKPTHYSFTEEFTFYFLHIFFSHVFYIETLSPFRCSQFFQTYEIKMAIKQSSTICFPCHTMFTTIQQMHNTENPI